MKPSFGFSLLSALAASVAGALAGPYSLGLNDPGNSHDAPVPGFIGPNGMGKARLYVGVDGMGDPIYQHPGNFVNPLFFAWADAFSDYSRADSGSAYNDPTWALGPVTGDNFDVVSLGEMSAAQISNGDSPGSIVLSFSKPIRNLSGADFVIFENSLLSGSSLGGVGIGGVFADLANVEVSADGVTFHRFPSTSLNPTAVGSYGSIDPSQVLGLAGKHVNAYGNSWGTPFDIGLLGINEVSHIRIVDIPGNGSFFDTPGNSIYDPWETFGSGGFDLEAVASISAAMTYDEWPQLESLPLEKRAALDDPDGDGICNLLEYAAATLPGFANTSGIEITFSNGEPAITFNRDERLTDLLVEVQVSPSLEAASWVTLATSTAGAPLQAAAGQNPAITEVSASEIRSIGVIRRTTVRDTSPTAARKFLRVKATRIFSNS